MPKETRASGSRQMQLTPFLDPLVVVYETRKVVIRRTEDYQVRTATVNYPVPHLTRFVSGYDLKYQAFCPRSPSRTYLGHNPQIQHHPESTRRVC